MIFFFFNNLTFLKKTTTFRLKEKERQSRPLWLRLLIGCYFFKFDFSKIESFTKKPDIKTLSKFHTLYIEIIQTIFN